MQKKRLHNEITCHGQNTSRLYRENLLTKVKKRRVWNGPSIFTKSPKTGKADSSYLKKQTYLNIGQQKSSKLICARCQMLYSSGLPEDESIHRSYCNRRLGSFKLIKGMDIVDKYTVNTTNEPAPSYCIVRFHKDSNPQYLKMLQEFKDLIVDHDMGFVREEHSLPVNSQLVFICFNEKLKIAVGYACVELLQDTSTKFTGETLGDETPLPSSQESPLGIRQIWVDASYRRKGIAAHLLDAARTHYFYNYVVPKNRIAFSQPTEQGTILARAYVGDDTFLTYSFKDS